MNWTAISKKVLIISSAATLSFSANAQESNRTSTPQWVIMMNDPNTNYYEAVKAFDDFWKGKEKPVEEDEVFSNKEKHRETKKVTDADAAKYKFEYKKFLNWKRETAPFVRAYGHILTAEERLQLFEEERKRREQAQGVQ